MKSSSASVVGAMTRAARASRKRRSMPSSLRKAAPPHTFIARSVTSRGLRRGRLDLQHAQHARPPRPVLERGQGVGEERRALVRLGSACARSRPGGRLLGQRPVEVLEPGAR